MTMRSVITVGVFENKNRAEGAIAGLRNAGFSDNQISCSEDTDTTGGGFVEAIKRFFTGDTDTNNVVDDLRRMGLSSEEAHYYAHEHQNGHPIVAVQAPGREQEALSILRANGAYDYRSSRGASMAGGSYTRPTTDTGARPGVEAQTGRPSQTRPGVENVETLDTDEERTIRLREERLQAEKQRLQTGEVRVHKEVVTEQRNIEVPVTREEVVIEYHPVAEHAAETPISEGETIRVPVSEEQVHITKTPVETGEVTIGKREVEETKQYTGTVRREEARLEQEGQPTIRTQRTDEEVEQ
jgi:uncharacterized protein (TIGR02271 family)